MAKVTAVKNSADGFSLRLGGYENLTFLLRKELFPPDEELGHDDGGQWEDKIG